MDIRMPSINKVMITGNVVRDPETRILENGTHMAKISVANNQNYRDRNGEWQEKTCYVTVVAWRRTAELVGEYCRKGSPVLVEGELVYNSWEDRDGSKRSRIEINARRIQFLEKRGQSSSGNESSGQSSSSESSSETIMPDDDIPF